MKSHSFASDHQTLRYADEPGDDVMQIAVVRVRRHPVKAPMAFVVGMKQNDVRLDAEFLQVGHALFEVLEIISG